MQGDEAVGLHQAQADHGHERRSARDQASLAIEPRDRVERVAQRFGLQETEGMKAHAYLAPGAAARTASMILV
jgi:hypothetical protein